MLCRFTELSQCTLKMQRILTWRAFFKSSFDLGGFEPCLYGPYALNIKSSDFIYYRPYGMVHKLWSVKLVQFSFASDLILLIHCQRSETPCLCGFKLDRSKN